MPCPAFRASSRVICQATCDVSPGTLPNTPDQRPGAADERGGAAGPTRGATPTIDASSAALRRVAPRAHRGFTLIEMMIAVTVAGVLSSVAYPAYQGTVTKTRRADALAASMAVQAAEERYRSGALSYGSLGQIGAAATSPAGHYQISIVNPSASGYTVLATATGSQAGDTDCRYLKLIADGANLGYASGADAATSNNATDNRRCWNL